ncbi:MAG: LacI family DNA-binding transcriptional regulator [Spirochaetales bacterium]|nr:LacI family DNA-binding transcriptional regulator [Spirochaetales bacterium]
MAKNVSLQIIADSLGISRGTVDRAIHGRGRISTETRERVLAEARRLGYIDRKVESFLPLQQAKVLIAVIPGGDPFFEKIEEGIKKAVNEMNPSPELELVNIQLDNPELQSEYLLSVSRRNLECCGLIVVPSEDPILKDAINEVENSGVRVAALNTDAPESGRSLFIGQDLYASGRAAGELMLKMNNESTVILSGFDNIWAHSERVRGFQDVYRESGRLHDLIGPYYTHDNISETGLILQNLPDRFSGVYSVSGLTTEGAGRKLQDSNIDDVTLVGFDCTEANIKLLKDGYISCLISQSPQLQGYLSARRLMSVVNGELPAADGEIRIPIDIYFKENIDFYLNHLEL